MPNDGNRESPHQTTSFWDRLRATVDWAESRLEQLRGGATTEVARATEVTYPDLEKAADELTLHVRRFAEAIGAAVHGFEERSQVELDFGLKLKAGEDVPMLEAADVGGTMKVKLIIKPAGSAAPGVTSVSDTGREPRGSGPV